MKIYRELNYIREINMGKFFNGAFAWLLLPITVTGDFLVAYALAPFYKSYSHKLMVMSALGGNNSPVKVYYNIWLVILGLLLLVSAFTVYFRYCHVSKPLSIIATVLIVVFAIGAGILSGIFNVGEGKELETTASKIHGISAASGFMSLCFLPLILSILSFRGAECAEGVLFLLSFVFALLFFVLFIMADRLEFQNTVVAFEGLWQRLALLFMYVPLIYISVQKLMILPRAK